MFDAQLAYLCAQLRSMREHGLSSVDVRRDAQDRWNERIHRRLEGTIWTAGGCSSYYLDATGSNASAWPSTMASMHRALAEFPLADYHQVPKATAPSPV